MKQSEKVRINVFLEPDLAKELIKFGQELGYTKTRIVSLATSLGFQVMKVSRDPKMAKYYEKELLANEKK